MAGMTEELKFYLTVINLNLNGRTWLVASVWDSADLK